MVSDQLDIASKLITEAAMAEERASEVRFHLHWADLFLDQMCRKQKHSVLMPACRLTSFAPSCARAASIAKVLLFLSRKLMPSRTEVREKREQISKSMQIRQRDSIAIMSLFPVHQAEDLGRTNLTLSDQLNLAQTELARLDKEASRSADLHKVV